MVEFFPITGNGIFHVESVKNTLFYNYYKRKFITCDRLDWCWRNIKKRPKHLAWNVSKSWWRPFLSHVMVFFMLNQSKILYFTIIIRKIHNMWQVALVLNQCRNRLNHVKVVYWTSINISCNRETLDICKTIRIVISNL